MTVLHPAYFPNIAQCVAIAKTKEILFENEDNFQKQTYRNRTYIHTTNGVLQLTVPILHHRNASGHQKYKDIQIDQSTRWYKNHQKSIQIAYQSSAYYEYYQDLFDYIFQTKHRYLIDLNYKTFELLQTCLQQTFHYSKTTEYKACFNNETDARHLINAKSNQKWNFSDYYQTFQEKNGFIQNLSCIDLICHEGPRSLEYLHSQAENLNDGPRLNIQIINTIKLILYICIHINC